MPEEIQNSGANFSAVSRIIELLDPLSISEREHVLRTIATWFRIGLPVPMKSVESSTSKPIALSSSTDEEKFSNRPVLSAKEFILEKDPVTEVERLACLAYYLTHYQGQPHFKTIDLSRLNTEAAQRKLSNPTVAANNAVRDGFFVQASKSGSRQLSAMGERFVQLLPKREAAQQMKQRMSNRRRKRSNLSDSEVSEVQEG